MKTINPTFSLPDDAKTSSALDYSFRPLRQFPLLAGVLLSLAVLGGLAARAQPGVDTYSLWDDTAVPALLAANDPDGVELGMRFRSAVDGYITGIRFYKGEGNGGTHIGNLWTTGGMLMGSVVFDSETASGWQQQALPTPIPITSNTTYVVSYYAPVGHYAATLDYFTAAYDNYPLRALADGEDGPNGIYVYGPASSFPFMTYRSANYWVDVVMTESECGSDTNPPAIVVPADVIMPCADCDLDPTNTGTATATDDCSVTVSYSDAVCGICPKVVKRTWTATDGAGNTASGVQTITCLPPSLVTDSAGCIFDRNPATPEQDFRLIFVQDPQRWPCYKLVASNPGQFFYNVFYSGNPGEEVTFNLTLPYPFVTQGANPIQAYDWVTVDCGDMQKCLAPSNAFLVSSQLVRLAAYGKTPRPSLTVPVTLTVPDSGFVYLAVHLDYGLKGSTGYLKNLAEDAVDSATGTKVLITNHGIYTFTVSGAQSGAAGIQNDNVFKRIPGIGGLVLYQAGLDPVPGTAVTLKKATGATVGSATTDDDGFYMIAYKHIGKAATYYVSIATPPPDSYTEQKATTLKANSYVNVDFWVP